MIEPCKKCGSTDRTPSGACRPCMKKRNAFYNAKKAGGVKARAKSMPRISAPVAPSLSPSLILGAGWGLEAQIDGAYLQLIQRDDDGNSDTIMLSRSEAKALFEAFDAWATGEPKPPQLAAAPLEDDCEVEVTPKSRSLKPVRMAEEANPHTPKLAAGIEEMRGMLEKKARGSTL